VAFIGPLETGKTHLATALGLKAVAQRYNVLFTTVNQMFEACFKEIIILKYIFCTFVPKFLQ
jgi:DNA replication protein DnaC